MTIPDYDIGRLVGGDMDSVRKAYTNFKEQEIDQVILKEGPYPYPMNKTTIVGTEKVSGRGTFSNNTNSTLVFSPGKDDGWWINRTDLGEQFPFKVSIRNVWTTARNIVLRCGNPHNYLRMVEHIIALKVGMAVDNMLISTETGDPPLFERGNLDLVEAVLKSGITETKEPAKFITVKEPVTFGGPRGDFLTYLPAQPGQYGLRIDCAIDFNTAIGKQRIVFDVTPETFKIGAEARTNAPLSQLIYTKTLGKLFADTRNLGYTTSNILIHGKKKYFNEAKLVFEGKSLEAVWHRATLDLLAAVALIEEGRLAGTIVSYRAGHTQDVQMISQLCLHDLLTPMT
jgi:UDP-3-O-[3-hydroxymyristoyl] N-acetylglucosamine deacetylase